LHIRDPHKEEKMTAIHGALQKCSVDHPVFYEDEVDIHLNPKIGADWQVRGQQKRVVTPARTKNIIWRELCTAEQEKSATSGEQEKLSTVYQSAGTHESDIPTGENDHAYRR
jgi:hypothetical protein